MTQSGGGGGGNLGAAVLRITVDDGAARAALNNLQAQIRAVNGGLDGAQNRNRNNRNADNGVDEPDRSLLAQQAILKRVQAVRKQISDLEARDPQSIQANAGLRDQANSIASRSSQGVTRALREQLNALELLTKEEKNYYSVAKATSDFQPTPGVPLSRRAQRSTRNSVRDSLFDLDKLERTGFDTGRVNEMRNQGLALQLSLERGITAESQRRAEILKDGVTAAKQEQTLNGLNKGKAQNDDSNKTDTSLLAQQGALKRLQTLRNDLNTLEIKGGDAGRVGEIRAQVLRLEEQALRGVNRELREQINTVALLAKEEKNYNGQQTLSGARKNTAGVPLSIEAQRKAQKDLSTIGFDLDKQERKGADPVRLTAQRNELLSIQAASEQNINGAVLRRIALLKDGVKESERQLQLNALDLQAQKAAELAAARKATAAERSERAAERSARAAEREARATGRDGSGASRERTKFGPLESGGEALGLSVLLGRGPVGTIAGVAGGVGGDILGGRRGGRVGYGLGFAFGGLVDDAVTRLRDLGDALRDPVTNFSKLREAAVLSSRSFEDLSQAMIESGRTSQASALIQLDLVRRYGSQNALAQASQSGDSLRRGTADLQDRLNPSANVIGSVMSSIFGKGGIFSNFKNTPYGMVDVSDPRLSGDNGGPKYASLEEAAREQAKRRYGEEFDLRRASVRYRGQFEDAEAAKSTVARLQGSGLTAAGIAAGLDVIDTETTKKFAEIMQKAALDVKSDPKNAGLITERENMQLADVRRDRDNARASILNQQAQLGRNTRDRGELLNATGGLTGSGLSATEDATKRLQYEREIKRLKEESAKYPALEAASRLDILAIEQNITELANKRMLAERSLAADRVASEGRIASLSDRSMLAARSVNLTGTGNSILSAIADYRNAQRELANAQARAFANPGDQSAALALKEAMESVRTSAVETSAKLIQGFRTARTEALAASTSLAQGVARLGTSRSDPNGIRKYAAPFSLYNLDRNTNALLYPQFDKARNYINNLTGGGFKFNYNGTQKDINNRMADVINLVAQDRMNSNLEDLRRANDQATQALAVARDGLMGNSEVMKDLNGSVAALVAKDWSVNVAVNGASAGAYASAVNRGL